MSAVDLSADLGEGFGAYTMGNDDALLEVVTSANIACGFHAGDPQIMYRTATSCVTRGVGIGAHPGFPDLRGFGRRDVEVTAHEVKTDVLYQIGALAASARAAGGRLAHVTPHGRLGNLAVIRADYSQAIVDAVVEFDPSIIVVSQEGALISAARRAGLPVGIIGFADRLYEDDGTLVKRSVPGSVLHDPAEITDRALRMVQQREVVSVSGKTIPVIVDTILLHGDNSGAENAARGVLSALVGAGVDVVPLTEVLKRK